MGYMLLIGDGRIVDVERRLDEDTRLFYYIVQIGQYSITFRGNKDYAGAWSRIPMSYPMTCQNPFWGISPMP